MVEADDGGRCGDQQDDADGGNGRDRQELPFGRWHVPPSQATSPVRATVAMKIAV